MSGKNLSRHIYKSSNLWVARRCFLWHVIAVNISTMNTFKILDCLFSDRYLRYVQDVCFLVSQLILGIMEVLHHSNRGSSNSPWRWVEANLRLSWSCRIQQALNLNRLRGRLHQLGSDFLGWTVAVTHPARTVWSHHLGSPWHEW